MITYDYALLQAANLRVSYEDREMIRFAECFVNLNLSDAKDIILALCQTSDLPVKYFRGLLEDNSDILRE